MRFRLLGLALAAALLPALAWAQSSPPPATTAPSAKPDGISREDYIKRAEQQAGARFDRMDTDHDGILTREETKTYRATHHRQHHRSTASKRGSASEPAPEKQQ
jgi:hypothetical protein